VERRIFVVAVVALGASLAGCFGAGARSDWAYEAVGLDATYDDGLRGRGVVVAVIDTGINLGHPSLEHLKDGDEGDGEVIAFKDFYTGKEGVGEAIDPAGHGSHVASIIAARGSGFMDRLVYNADLLGGAPGVQLVIARVCNESCKTDAIDDAVDWAVVQGAKVISMSLGGTSGLPPAVDDLLQSEIEASVNAAIDRGVVVIASAGNNGPDNEDVSSPANIPGVLAVGAVDGDLAVWEESSRGDDVPCRPGGGLFEGRSTSRCYPSKKPEIVAPGVDILGAWSGDSYVRATGTSQATPFVTSAVAVMLEGRTPLTDREDVLAVKRVLVDTASPLPGQGKPHDAAAGYGLLQADRAVAAYR